ncbi:ABC transporter permease [Sphingobacterium endophyticum]|uniref:ABC transporter permease n=1 Tax=Sphingobacterium endophyticum TaxID=2546448 RepID=UPI0012E311A5|nr:FtsX-like permease family protein [Sphingobacterium endophyticum]
MKLPLFFAKRYLFSKKSVNAINIISSISMIGVLVSTTALVIVLSFYNGLERFILSQYSTFSPEFRIEPASGKVFSTKSESFKKLRALPEISSYSEVLEDKILAEYNQQQFIGRLKGIEPNSLHHVANEDMLLEGELEVELDSTDYAILGPTVQANLQVPLQGDGNQIILHIPDKKAPANSINPLDDIRTRVIKPGAVLGYQPGFEDLIIVPINFAKDLLNEYEQVSAIELYGKNDNSTALQREIQRLLGKDYLVKNREQQNPTLYKTVRSEKWIVFFIVTIIGIIAIFNIIGSLTMLVIDKKQDMVVLDSLGANNSLIQNIFFYQGILIALIGSAIGILVGLTFCILQEKFGFVTTSEGSLFDAYPVDIRYMDLILIFMTVMIVSTLVSYMASRLNIRGINRRGALEAN